MEPGSPAGRPGRVVRAGFPPGIHMTDVTASGFGFKIGCPPDLHFRRKASRTRAGWNSFNHGEVVIRARDSKCGGARANESFANHVVICASAAKCGQVLGDFLHRGESPSLAPSEAGRAKTGLRVIASPFEPRSVVVSYTRFSTGHRGVREAPFPGGACPIRSIAAMRRAFSPESSGRAIASASASSEATL